MRSIHLAGLISTALLATACASPATAPVVVAAAPDMTDDRVTVNAPQKTDAAAQENRIVVSAMRTALRTSSLDAYLKALSDGSCPRGVDARAAEAIDMTATPIAMNASNPAQRKIGTISFVTGYELNSSDPRFGGLSGIEVLADGNLLAISDKGYFVWIDLDRDGVKPMAARLSTMRDAGGQPMAGIAGDGAEGLAVNGGMALVSFEGNHRVLAFDVRRCGAAARGAPIVFDNFGLPLREAFEESRITVGERDGSEPLAVTQDWYMFMGIEKKSGGTNSLSARPIEAEPDFDLRVGVEAPEFAGIDVVPGTKGNGSVRAFLVHRAPGAKDGAARIMQTDLHRYEDHTRGRGISRGEMEARARQRYSETGWRELAQFDQVGLFDRYEGIAARELSDGRVRLYLISDDDFSATDRTALMIFDVPKPTR
jgi:hypothetical protein